ncbi:MAG: endonuclease/exonuclease/phosphatase family protein [Bacteroidota bacterium]|nr:endonuclease/exonuclease/phosphatase family protein [Bacteroidota bacterium]
MKIWMTLLTCICFVISLSAQKTYEVACIAFYNFENLFDTIDSPDTDDFEFTPLGTNIYNSYVYKDKLERLAGVVGEIGLDYTPDGPALLGVSEVENRSVLEDFARQAAVAKRNYNIIHQDSKDGRGIDVALLYQPKYFKPDTTIYYSLVSSLPNEEVRYSRDILIAIGDLNGEKVAISVNHWPSRRGGEATTAHLRNKAATVNRHLLDSLYAAGTVTKSIVMGDLNDDPINDSVHKFLKAGRITEKLLTDEMYNPMEDFYRKGSGTTAYQDAWSLFDQIILSNQIVSDTKGFHFYKAGIHNPAYMTQKTGKYKGYPMRTYANGVYAHGYSDHFPVYVLLVKEKV